MPSYIWLVLWVVSVTVLACFFGGIAAGVTWWMGRGSGTGLARRVAENAERIKGSKFSQPAMGFLVGAVDGFVLATAMNVVILSLEPGRTLVSSAEFRLGSLLAAVGIGAAAIFLGSIVHVLVWARDSSGTAVGAFVCTFFAVALVSGRYHLGDPILLGLLAGVAAGPLTMLLLKRRAKRNEGQAPESAEPQGSCVPRSDD